MSFPHVNQTPRDPFKQSKTKILKLQTESKVARRSAAKAKLAELRGSTTDMETTNFSAEGSNARLGAGAGAGPAEDMEIMVSTAETSNVRVGAEAGAEGKEREVVTKDCPLPNEMLNMIFSYVGVGTLKNVCLAGSVLELKACAERLLYRNIQFEVFLNIRQYPVIPDRFEALNRTMREKPDLQKHFRTLTLVDDRNSFANPSNTLMPVTLTEGVSQRLSLLCSTPWLHTLVLSTTRNLFYLSPLAVYELMTLLPTLKSLTIQGFALPRGDLDVVRQKRGTSGVEKLHFDNIQWMEAKTLALLVQLCKQLKTFHCHCRVYVSFTHGTAPALFEPYQDCLEALSVGNSHEFYDETDQLTKFTALTDLTIRENMFWPTLDNHERIMDAEQGVKFIVDQFLPKGLKTLKILNSCHWHRGILKYRINGSSWMPTVVAPGGWTAIMDAFRAKGIKVEILTKVSG